MQVKRRRMNIGSSNAKSSAIVKLLQREVRAKNVNACAGILRRIITETVSPTKWIYANYDVVGEVITMTSDRITSLKQVDATISSTLSSSSSLHHVNHDFNNSHDIAMIKPASLGVLANVSALLARWQDALLFVDPVRGQGDIKVPFSDSSPLFMAKLMTRYNAESITKWCDHRRIPFCVSTAIARIGVLGGAWDIALRIAQRYEYLKGEKYTAGVLVPFLASGGNWSLALHVFGDGISQGAFLDGALLNNMVGATSAHGHWHTCLSIVSALHRCAAWPEVAYQCKGIHHTYDSIMKCCKTWNSALSLISLMVANHNRPSTKVVAAAIALCDGKSQWEAASRLFEFAKTRGLLGSLSETSRSQLVRTFNVSHQWEKAIETLNWMGKAENASVDTGLITTIDLCEKSGQWAMALKIAADKLFHQFPFNLNDTQQHGHIPSKTYASVLHSCASGKQWDAAITVYKRMISDVCVTPHPMAACSALQACVAANQWHACMSLFSYMISLEPGIVMPPVGLRLAMKACIFASRWEEALLLSKMSNQHGLPHDNHTQRCGLWAAALVGSWMSSLAYYNNIPTPLRTRKDKELVEFSAMKRGLAAQERTRKLLEGSAR